jgi:hypothetical protein
MLIKKSSLVNLKIEKFLKPRCLFMTSPIAEKITGLFLFLFSSFIMLPIPLSNYIPGIGILITSFGMLSKDGLFIIFGIFIGCLGLIISILAVFLGMEFFSSFIK